MGAVPPQLKSVALGRCWREQLTAASAAKPAGHCGRNEVLVRRTVHALRAWESHGT